MRSKFILRVKIFFSGQTVVSKFILEVKIILKFQSYFLGQIFRLDQYSIIRSTFIHEVDFDS